MTNDTEVFDAMRFDVFTGQSEWTKRTGTQEAIHRDGFLIDPLTQGYCPREWIDSRGYVDLELSQLLLSASSRIPDLKSAEGPSRL
jgi:hypothetical protein